ncbi:MAG: PaaI family thioesterase [Nocardioides sp.]|uniref:PaaI family thioesterase n=1 Tax=Nocardioides sp. TaxID=35761 RepID=UPI003F0E2299
MSDPSDFRESQRLDDGGPVPRTLTSEPRPDGLDAAAAAVRRLSDSLLRLGESTPYDLDTLTKQLQSLADEVDAHRPAEDERMREMWRDRPRHDPATGPQNPVAPPLVVHGLADGSVRGEVTLGIAYQGQPGMAHGGISALMLDHALGFANGWAGIGGMTARLTLNYKRPTPLFVPLTVRALQTRVEGRKIWCEAYLEHDGELLVSAEALFIQGHLPRPK